MGLLAEHHGRVVEQLRQLGCTGDDETFMFSSVPDYSTPQLPNSITQRYLRMARRLKLRSTRLHALRPPGLVIDGVDLTRPDLWAAFTLGYQWGTTHGIDLGRQELAAELMPVGTVIADLKLWRGVSYAELHRRRTTYTRPALTAEQIYDQAARSWVESPDRSGTRVDHAHVPNGTLDLEHMCE